MTRPTLRFCFREPTIDTILPFTDGTLGVEGFELERTESEDDADALDQRFGKLVVLKSRGSGVVPIPAFPNRKFRHSYIVVNQISRIETPKDLEGKRVGILAWANTAGVWARGALQNYYGVDLTQINWKSVAKRDAVAAPSGMDIQALPECQDGPDQMMDEMLVKGDLDAVISPNVLRSISQRDPRVRRLFDDYVSEETKYFQDTGIFPISHVVTLTEDFVERYPNAPVKLLAAHRRARDVAFERIEGSDPWILTIPWASAMLAKQRELMGDEYWAYNVESNRITLEAMMQYAFEQGLTDKRQKVEGFFHPDAVELPGM